MLAEHASLYQYSLVNAQNHYIGFAQTETVSDESVCFSFELFVDVLHFTITALLSALSCRSVPVQFLVDLFRSYIFQYYQHGLGYLCAIVVQHHLVW